MYNEIFTKLYVEYMYINIENTVYFSILGARFERPYPTLSVEKGNGELGY